MIGCNFILATATYDKTNKKVYATINGDVPFSKGGVLLPFSIGGNVLAIIDDRFSFLARVEEFETLGDTATMELSFHGVSMDYLFNSRSEKPVLLRGLSNSKPLEKPSATINVAAVPTPAALSALKERELLGTITFAEAFALTNLDTSSQVTVKINQGNPKTMVETFFADKVKAKISTKGDNDFLEIWDGSQLGILASDDQQNQERLDRYLNQMRQELREEDGGAFFNYSVSLVDKNLNVVLNNQSVKRVRRTRNGGEINYTLEFDGGAMAFSALPYTVLIEKETVTNTDYIRWAGSSGIPAHYLSTWNKESPLEVEYVKKHIDGLAFDYLELENPRFDILNNKLASFTVGDKTIHGNIKLSEDNKVILAKPKETGQVAWGKDLAAFQPSGKGLLTSLEQGSLAKDETLQLKVELNNLEYAWEYFKTLQATPTTSVLELLPQLGQLKVTNADVAAAKAGVTILTGIETLATGTVKWYNDYVEILVKNNSEETFNVFNSNGADEGFQEVGVARFLNAVVADVKETYQLELQNIINPTSASDYVVWSADFQVMGENYRMVIQNAEVKQTTSGTTYKFYYDQGILEQLFRVGNHDDVIVILTRTESQRTL